jgi:hypothetical protein|tara:strand:+ start:7743 stop:8225 length:483 start_codon:yes stop_codon:yes gene_type:complete
MHAVTGVEGEVVVKSLATDWGQVDPDLRVARAFNRVGEVDLVSTLVDAFGQGRDLEGNARVLRGAVAPWLLIPTTRTDGQVLGMRRAHVGHRPDVDRLRAVVGDDGLGLGESHEATDGENAADHDVDRVWGRIQCKQQSDERDIVERIMDDWGIDGQLDG